MRRVGCHVTTFIAAMICCATLGVNAFTASSSSSSVSECKHPARCQHNIFPYPKLMWMSSSSSSSSRAFVVLNVARGDRFARTIGSSGGTKGKVHIQLLETIPSIGQKGDIMYVSPAVYQNQLKRGNKARLITDEEIRRMEANKSEVDRLLLEAAVRTKVELEGAMVVDNLREDGQCGRRRSTTDESSSIRGVALEMKRRAGPEGNLFGGVTPRMILDGLKVRYPVGSWDGKLVKVTTVKDAESGNEIKTKDIKRIGDYIITVMLWKDIDVTFILSIAAE